LGIEGKLAKAYVSFVFGIGEKIAGTYLIILFGY
jgi:hypothetical protein